MRAWLLGNVSDVIVFSNSLATWRYMVAGDYSIVAAQQIFIDELVIIDY